MGRRALVVDAAALAVFAVVSLPSLTGYAAHEWIGLVLTVALAVHLAMRLDRALRLRGGSGVGRALRIALDALLAVTLVICAVSGVFVSGAVLPALGLYAEGYWLWDPLHAASAKLLLALLIVHLAVNARAVAGLIEKGKGESRES